MAVLVCALAAGAAGTLRAEPQKEFSKAVEHCENRAGAYDTEDAIQNCSFALTSSTVTPAQRARILLLRGQSLLRSGDVQSALQDIETGLALAANPRDQAAAYRLRGRARDAAGRKQEAEADYARARQLDSAATAPAAAGAASAGSPSQGTSAARAPTPPAAAAQAVSPRPAPETATLAARKITSRMGDSISCEFIALPSLSLGHGNDRLGTNFQYSVRTAGPLPEHSGYILYGHVETSRQPAQLVFDRLEFQVHNKAFAGASATLADVLIDGRRVERTLYPVTQRGETVYGIARSGDAIGAALLSASSIQFVINDRNGKTVTETFDVRSFRQVPAALEAANYRCGGGPAGGQAPSPRAVRAIAAVQAQADQEEDDPHPMRPATPPPPVSPPAPAALALHTTERDGKYVNCTFKTVPLMLGGKTGQSWKDVSYLRYLAGPLDQRPLVMLDATVEDQVLKFKAGQFKLWNERYMRLYPMSAKVFIDGRESSVRFRVRHDPRNPYIWVMYEGNDAATFASALSGAVTARVSVYDAAGTMVGNETFQVADVRYIYGALKAANFSC